MLIQKAIDITHSKKAIGANYTLIRVWDSESEQFLIELKEAKNAGTQILKDFINKKQWTYTSVRHSDEEES